MSKKYFMPRTNMGKFEWLQNFANKIATYATKYGITTSEVADMVASALFYAYWNNYNNQYAEYQKKLTKYLAELREGVEPGSTASIMPTAPIIGTVPPSVKSWNF